MTSPAQNDLPLYVIGHRNPDTDAICSAIGQAELLRLTGEPSALAARCGEVPERAAWVLEQAGLEAPRLVVDVRVSAGQICRREVVYAKPEDTFLTAYQRMVRNGVKAAPVVNESGEVLGILRYLDLLKLLLPAQSGGIAVRTMVTNLAQLAETLSASSNGADIPEEAESDLHFLVAASSLERVHSRLETARRNGHLADYLVLCGDRPGVQRMAIEMGVKALIITGGFRLDEELAGMAREGGVVVLECQTDTAGTTTLIRCSRSVRSALVGAKFRSIAASEPITSLRKKLADQSQDLFPVVGDDGKRLMGVLSKSDFVSPPRQRVVLVDHNEYAQAVRGVNEAEVIEVIDHHRLAGDLVSREPIRFLNEPVGSTSTLVARKFRHRGLKPSRASALCLCAGIISDTLHLTSPTTTDLDREILDWLTQVAEIDPEEFTAGFFAVGSLLASAPAMDIICSDRKEFSEDEVRLSISQIEELGTKALVKRQGELLAALDDLREKNGLHLALLAVTDIVQHNSTILASGAEEFLQALPFERVTEQQFLAPGTVSRKKQIFPAVADACREVSHLIER